MKKLRPEQFDALVEEAVEGLPEKFRRHLSNVEIDVQDHPSRDLLAEMGLPPGDPLFGVFQGPTEGEMDGFFDLPALPPRITIFQRPIERECSDRPEVLREIRLTVLHEIGHYFGLDEDDLERWEDEIYESAAGAGPGKDGGPAKEEEENP